MLLEAIDYSQKAMDTFNTAIGTVDFSIFMTMTAAVITATIGARIGMIALRKGYNTLVSFIRGL